MHIPGAELAEDHPGFRDEEYKQRRVNIATLARAHEMWAHVIVVKPASTGAAALDAVSLAAIGAV
jgi:hypothetical protein